MIQTSSDSHSTADGIPDRTIGSYRLAHLIGAGGVTATYLAEHLLTGRKIALKVLASPPAPEAFERFLNEAKRAALIRHENMLELLEVGRVCERQLYIVTELPHGIDLRAAVRRDGPLAWKRVREIGLRISAAVAAAHEAGVVYRHLSPKEIFVSAGGDLQERIKLEPPGPAAETGVWGVAPGIVAGAAGYVAPEQIEEQPVDERADVYSLGSVLYFMLTGSPPFEGGSTIATLGKQLEGKVEPPSRSRPDFETPVTLDAIVVRALQRDPGQRWPDVRSLADALERCEVPTIAVGEDVAAAGQPEEVALSEQPSGPGKRRAVMLGIAAVVAVGALGLTLPRTKDWQYGASSPLPTEPPPVAPSLQQPAPTAKRPIPPVATQTRASRSGPSRPSKVRSNAEDRQSACRVSLGSIPWSEVWIDDQNVGVTPLVGLPIRCGRRRIVWRNQELAREHREVLAISPGGNHKRIVHFDPPSPTAESGR